MTREIKFRAKDINGKWVFGDLIHKGGELYIRINKRGSHIKVDENTIGQFTGFKDYYGREIYEGDIIAYVDIANFHHAFEVKLDRFLFTMVNLCDTLVVTGNIYDDPESLIRINKRK